MSAYNNRRRCDHPPTLVRSFDPAAVAIRPSSDVQQGTPVRMAWNNNNSVTPDTIPSTNQNSNANDSNTDNDNDNIPVVAYSGEQPPVHGEGHLNSTGEVVAQAVKREEQDRDNGVLSTEAEVTDNCPMPAEVPSNNSVTTVHIDTPISTDVYIPINQNQEQHYNHHGSVTPAACVQNSVDMEQNGENPEQVDTNIKTEDYLQTIKPTVIGIEDCALQRSVGHTRQVLNKHLAALGLMYFGQTVLSCRNGRISHLTLNLDWNDLPQDQSGRLQWWLGKGPTRLAKVQPLNVSQHPDQPAIPIFWAEKQKRAGKGGALCRYVGHFKCVTFDTTYSKVMYKKEAQALLEFEFVHFDEVLADKLANIPTQTI